MTDDRVDTGLSSTVMPTETHSSKILFHLESKGDDFSGPTRWEINSTITPWFPLEIGLTPWKTHFPSTRSEEVQRPWELASVLIPPYQFAPLRLSCALPGGKASSSIPAIKWSVKLCFPSSCFIPHSHIEFLSSDFLYFFGSFLSYFKPNPKQSRIFFQDWSPHDLFYNIPSTNYRQHVGKHITTTAKLGEVIILCKWSNTSS